MTGVNLDELPEHIEPLLAEIEKYPEDVREDMKRALVASCKTIWKDRLVTWIKQHPRFRGSSDVPPIVEHEGKLIWMTRQERRK